MSTPTVGSVCVRFVKTLIVWYAVGVREGCVRYIVFLDIVFLVGRLRPYLKQVNTKRRSHAFFIGQHHVRRNEVCGGT